MKHIQRHIADAYIFDHQNIKDQTQQDPDITNHLIAKGLLVYGNPWDSPENTSNKGTTRPTATTSSASERTIATGSSNDPYISKPNGEDHSESRIPFSDKSTIVSSEVSVTEYEGGVVAIDSKIEEKLFEDAASLPAHNLRALELDPEDRDNRQETAPGAWERMKGIKSLLLLFLFSVIYTTLFVALIIVVLINQVVETPSGVFWDASTTNYVVSVLSQFSGLLTEMMFSDLFAILRPVLATANRNAVSDPPKPCRQGSSFATWVGLSPAAGWLQVFQVAALGRFTNPLCDFRFFLPLLALAFGSIIKFQANFEFYFIPGPPDASLPVYAGLTPPNVDLLAFINASDLVMYVNTWSSSLLGASQFAQDFPIEGCEYESCRSVFLPGSLENARLVHHNLNLTLYSVDNFRNSDFITIFNAPEMVVEFEDQNSTSLVFDLDADCVYIGQNIVNGVQLCFRQDGISMVVGWSASPNDMYDQAWYNSANATWRADPIELGTRMSLFRQVATTSYDRRNQPIINVEVSGNNSRPQQLPLSAEEYRTVVARALRPTAGSTATDRNNINTLGYTLAWIHRLHLTSSPMDKTSAVTYLHNLLAAPVQFNIVAQIFGNNTVSQNGYEGLALPDDMIVTARGGKAASRLVILPWAGWIFIAVNVALHVAVFAGIGYVMLSGKEVHTEGMGVEDFEAMRAMGGSKVVQVVVQGEMDGERRGFVRRVISRRFL